ncbi:TIGR02588 family protein [Agrobacterium sp. fls2-241-TYG-188a]|uniref:TIGR02588 family protein n=1 Tax=Agrobacterium sp. fls2-241-TYG-188a TaxID=3040275 RepID=UPI00254BA81A|nr:TIGR02588 family protein [Agrobacterium sp. fls2-241-TYG-188a]
MTKNADGKNIEAKHPHWIEWLTGMISAILVVVLIGIIAKDAFTDKDLVPDLSAAVTGMEQRSGGYQIAFDITNKASVTASQVRVLGELKEGDEVVETAETVLDYVPGRSHAKGGMVFRSDISGKTVALRVSAFNEP